MKWALALMLLAAPAAAQSVGECGAQVSARNLAEPWEANTATYAEGDIRVAVIDMLEPAAAAVHLMVISPPRDEIGDRQCRLVSLQGGEGSAIGFYDLGFAERRAEYDPQRGLVLTMPASFYDPQTGSAEPSELTVTINQSSGEVLAEVSGS